MKHTTVSRPLSREVKAKYDASQTGDCGARANFFSHSFTSPAQLLSNSVFVTPGSKFTVRPSSTFTSNVTPLSLGFWWAPEARRHRYVIQSQGARLVTSWCCSLSSHTSVFSVSDVKYQVTMSKRIPGVSRILVCPCHNNESI